MLRIRSKISEFLDVEEDPSSLNATRLHRMLLENGNISIGAMIVFSIGILVLLIGHSAY